MKHIVIVILALAAIGMMAFPAFATAPLEQFAFQGVLKDSSGNLITGTRNIGLRLYTVYSGHTATNDATCLAPYCLWTENHTSVQVTSGIFTIDAGNTNSLTKVINFTNALYLEVIIRNSTAGDQILTPRLNVTAAPFAFATEKASTNLNLNKKSVINASNVYAAGTINGIIINNSTQAVSGISTLTTTSSITSGANLYTVASGTVNGITINNSTQAVSGVSSLTIQKGSSTVASISNTGIVNGSSVQVQNGGATVGNINSTGGITSSALQVTNSGSKVGSISKTGVVNGSSVQVQSAGSTVGSISSTGALTLSGPITSGGNINLGTNFLTNSGHQIGLPSNSGTILLTNGTLSGGALSGTISGSPTLSGVVTSTGGITMSGANINLGTNFLTNSGHQIGLPSNSGTILLTNGSLSSLTGNLNSVGGTFTGTVNTASAITAPTSTNTINGIIINSGAISGVSTLTTTSTITAGGNITANNGLIISTGHLSMRGSAPTLSSCGTSTISGTDNAGIITLVATACTINFHSKWTSAPACFVADLTSDFDPTGYTPTTTALSLTALTSGDKLMYICMGQ